MRLEQQAVIRSWDNICKRRATSYMGSPLPWVQASFNSLVMDSTTFPLTEQLVDTLNRNQSWRFVGSLIQPSESQLERLATPQEQLSFLIAKFQERELLEQGMNHMFGSLTAPVRLGDMKQFDLSLSNVIEDGQFYFSMRDHETGYEIALCALTIQDRKTVRIHAVQQHIAEPTSPTQDQVAAQHNLVHKGTSLRRHAEQRNHKVRRHIASHGGTRELLPIEQTMTPGVEEATMTTVVNLLQKFDLIDPDAQIIIPHPEFTYWGRSQGLGIEYGIKKAAANALANINVSQLAVLDGLVGLEDQMYTRQRPQDYRELAGNLYGHINSAHINQQPLTAINYIPLSVFFLNLLLSDISDAKALASAQQIIESFNPHETDYFLLYKQFIETSEQITRLTDSYKRQFYVYFTAFSNLPTNIHPEGRTIAIRNILQTPYANELLVG